MIVVEGPDGAGKTTLLKDIAEETGLEIAPRVVSKDTEAMVNLTWWVEQNLDRGWHPTLYDRHRLVSEPIYGPIMRQKLEPGFDDIYWLESMLEKFYRLQPLLIMCLPPLEVVQANLYGDPDNLAVANHIRQVWAGYFSYTCNMFALARPQHTPIIIHYDYTEGISATKQRSYILRRINSEIKRKASL